MTGRRGHEHREQRSPRRLRYPWAVSAVVAVLVLIAIAAVWAHGRPKASMPPTTLYAFYVDWDSSSYLSLSAHLGDISTLVPEWYHLGADGSLRSDSAQAQAKALKLIRARKPGMRVTPIVNDLDKATGQWDSKAVAAMLADPAKRGALAERIATRVHADGFQGVNIDFEGLPSTSRADLVAFMGSLVASARPLGLEVSQDVALSDATFDLPALADKADYLMPMMYDEHWSTSPAGAIASQDWFEGELSAFFKQVPPAKVVVAVGDYGYEWRNGSTSSSTLSFAEAVASARGAGTAISMDPEALNLTFARTGHVAWLLDAASAFNEIAFLRGYPVHGVALWRLGGGDPKLWGVLHERNALGPSTVAALRGAKRSVVYDAAHTRITGERIAP